MKPKKLYFTSFFVGFPLLGNAPNWALPSYFQWNYVQEPLLAYKDLQRFNEPYSLNLALSTDINRFFTPPYDLGTTPDLFSNKTKEEISFSPVTAFNLSLKDYLQDSNEETISSVPTSTWEKDKTSTLSLPEIQTSNFYKFPEDIVKVPDIYNQNKLYHNSKCQNFKYPLIEKEHNLLHPTGITSNFNFNFLEQIENFNKDNIDVKKEQILETQALFIHNSESISIQNNFKMSGQYPGHSRPPVGTPPPQTVWNHLTMTQGQGILFIYFKTFCLPRSKIALKFIVSFPMVIMLEQIIKVAQTGLKLISV